MSLDKMKEKLASTSFKQTLVNTLIAHSEACIDGYKSRVAEAEAKLEQNVDFEFCGRDYPLNSEERQTLRTEIDAFKTRLSGNKRGALFSGNLVPSVLALDFPLLISKNQFIKKNRNHRYKDVYARVDDTLKPSNDEPVYNGNITGHLGLFEGPFREGYRNTLLAFTQALSQWENVKTIFALGPAIENGTLKHTPYYKEATSSQITQDIHGYKWNGYEVYHFHQWKDHSAETLSAESIQWLYNMLCDEEYNIAIHCSAGIGRTGTLVLGYLLFKNFDAIFNEAEDEIISEKIIAELVRLREVRALVVQTSAQLMMSLHLAMAFKQQQRLNLKSSVNASIQKFDAKRQQHKRYSVRHDDSDKSSDVDTTESLSDDDSLKESQYSYAELLNASNIFDAKNNRLRFSVETLPNNLRVGFRGR